MALCKKPYITLNQETAPCGQCPGCLTNRKQLWTHRIILESYNHEQNSFVTLTYDDEHLPLNNDGIPMLRKRDLTLFIKRLRDRIPEKFRYYAVGEYGTKGTRGINPHFHLCLFGVGERDEYFIAEAWQKEKGRGSASRTSEPLGYTYTGSLTPQSAAYVAGYVQKKTKYNKDMYEELDIVPEYSTMSRRPGIGAHAVSQIAKIIEKQPSALTTTGDVPYSLKHGKRNLPLGNYLRDKLRQELDLDRTEEEFYDTVTGEITTRTKWHAKERQKDLQKAEMQHLRENPQENPQAGPLPQDAKISIKQYHEWKNAQAILNFEKRQQIFSKEKTL